MNQTTKSIQQLESDLWESADDLRANSKLNATEYSMPVLGLIFLRHATNRFYQVTGEIEATLPSRGGQTRPVSEQDFRGRAALFLPQGSRYDELVDLPDKADVGKAIDEAMTEIEKQSEMLTGALPKEYARFEPDLLRRLLRIFNSETLRQAEGDIFGRIYEYFLNKFAMSGAQEGGEFFTPYSLVQTIVNIVEPTHGLILDPAVGSAGMFVQTGHFLNRSGKDPNHAVLFHGQEKSEVNTRIARMNMAVHGLEGQIVQGNTFYDRLPDLIGQCDRVMANPPFNVDMVDPERIKGDKARLPFDLPGVSPKTKTVSNANYLWIQYFYTYLSDQGRAGFVMASSASDAGHGEKRIRQELIETGHVDVMVAIGTNFFYTRSLPCTLWFFDKNKPAPRQDQVLMLDARNIYRVVTRKIRDFSPEQLQNLTAIVWLYRGQSERYLALAADYLDQTHQQIEELQSAAPTLDEPLTELTDAIQSVADHLQVELTSRQSANGSQPDDADEDAGPTAEEVAAFQALTNELQTAATAYRQSWSELTTTLTAQSSRYADADRESNQGQHAIRHHLDELVDPLKAFQKQVNEATKLADQAKSQADKLASRLTQAKSAAKTNGTTWDRTATRDAMTHLDEARHATVDAIKACLYMHSQIVWLHDRFPDATFIDVPGLCKAVDRDAIEAADHSLTPGRYVGVAPQELTSEEDFEERMAEIHIELSGLNEEASELAEKIQENFAELAI